MADEKVMLGQLLGDDLEEEFAKFDMTEIKKVLISLAETDAHDLAHAEMLQQQSLRGADILSEYLSKVIKTVSYLEAEINSAKNKAALEYQAPDGTKTTADMRRWAGDSSDTVRDLSIKLAKAKGSKSLLEKKYDILIKSHHHFKDIASGYKRTILGYNQGGEKKASTGWE